MSESAHSLPRAILFDMDGTLTCPMLDFPKIKAEMGIANRPILEALAEMSTADRIAAEAVLHRHEEQAAANSTLNPGCHELLETIASRQIKSALITRNSRLSVTTVLARHALNIQVLVTREDAPPKPNPQPLLMACERLRINRDQAWMVGDGQYDVEAGCAAGIRTVWLSHGRSRPFEAQPWRTVQDLHELREMLQSRH